MIVFTHLFRTFKNLPKGKPCLDADNKGDPEFAMDVWKRLVNVFKPKTTALAVDLTDKLMQEAMFDWTETVTIIVSNICNLINRLMELGQAQQMLTVITRFEDSMIAYASKHPEGAIEHTWST